MNEIWARLSLIAGALAVAWVVNLVIRRRSTGESRQIKQTTLIAGVYLFTSSACPDCAPARRKLAAILGAEAFVEMSWEEQPGLFYDLGVTGVPATLIVDNDGSGVLWPGKPDRALTELGP